jgi:hypothetical protein
MSLTGWRSILNVIERHFRGIGAAKSRFQHKREF